MRYFKPALLVAAALIMMGSGTREMKLTKGIKPGNLAPEINFEGLSLKDNNYTLIQFWAAYDAESRAENVKMHNQIVRLNSEKLKMVAFAFDEKESIFEETVKADKLDASTQFNDFQGEHSEIYKEYHLDNGFSNLLVNPQGVIIAKNIQPEQLTGIISQQGVTL